jgi:N4-gp56 family major capsid protein
MAQVYGDGTNSTVGAQARTDFYNKKALIAVRDKQYFMPLANVQAMPKHHGKTIKQDVYLPLLDDLNINDQGIDASGATIDSTKFSAWTKAGALIGAAYTTAALAAAATGAAVVQQNSGNLYGSGKDIGLIAAKLPALTENGGRVNRVGFKRTQITGSIVKQGFFTEYTQESLDFDSDSELLSHITEEMVQGATELTEAALQSDLINSATTTGTAYFKGGTTKATVSGVVTYTDLMNLSIALDNNKTPKQTKVISGSRLVDTKTINGGRIMYVGSEMIPALRAMTDLHSAPAFVSVEKYADAGNTVNGEIGSIDQFRIVVVPEMQYSAKGGAANVDIYPMLVVGDGSFTTIGFQTDGKTVKFTTTHKKPGKDVADLNDPYGEKGFYSIKWYYGFMALRAERLGIIWTKAA